MRDSNTDIFFIFQQIHKHLIKNVKTNRKGARNLQMMDCVMNRTQNDGIAHRPVLVALPLSLVVGYLWILIF